MLMLKNISGVYNVRYANAGAKFSVAVVALVAKS
jgi:hypothetical protein